MTAFCASRFDYIDEGISFIGILSNHVVAFEYVEQFLRLRHIVGLSSSENQPHRITKGIGCHVQFGGQAAP